MSEAFALFGPGDELLGVSATFRELAGPVAPPRRAPPERLLPDLGFQADPEQPGVLRRGERRLRQRVERTPEGAALLRLEDVGEEAAARARRARFLSVASHDLRGSMANVRAFAAMLLGGRTELDPKARRWLEVIVRNADRALGTLKEYFEAAYSAAGALELDGQRQPVRPVLEAAIERAQGATSAKGVHLKVDVPPELPEAPVEQASLEQTLAGFLDHGLSRTPEGGQMELSARQAEGMLVVKVADPGPPIPEKEAARAFDPEERAGEERQLATGFRLGLAAARVQALGGRVGIEQGDGRTAFFFALPLGEGA